MSAASEGRNRRRFPRVPVRGEVSGRIHTVASAPVLDLSEGGALLEVPCALRPRSLYSFRLSLGEGRVLTLQSNVVRSYVHSFETVGKGESRVQYRAAIQFINLSEADRELLRLRLYGSPEAVAREAGAVPYDHSAEELLADLLASDTIEEAVPTALDPLTALLDEGEPFDAATAPPAPEPLPPLPDVEPLPPLPDVAPWPSRPELTPLEEPGTVLAAGTEPRPEPEPAPEPFPGAQPAVDLTPGPAPAAEAVAETSLPAAEPPAAEPGLLPEAVSSDTAPSTVPPEPPLPVATPIEAAQVEVVPRQPTPHPSAWQRIKGWISSRPAAERARGSSILGLGLDAPPTTTETPPVTERRDYARVVVEGSVSGEMGLVMQSDIEALSVGGLLARMPFAPVTGSELSFTIDIDERPIVVGGTVRNVQELRGDAGDVEYKVGLEFGPLDDEVRAVLKGYVERRLEEGHAEGAPLD